MPNDWKHGHLIKLPKKGKLKECSNWRGITLLSVPGKVFSRILLERIKTEVEKEHILRDEQAGFRQQKGKKRGLQWSLTEQLEDIDDIALISQRHTDMKQKKTKSLRLNHTSEATFTIRQDVTIEEVQDFAYLGSTVSTEGGTDQDIRIRIGKAAGVFNTLRPIWHSKSCPSTRSFVSTTPM